MHLLLVLAFALSATDLHSVAVHQGRTRGVMLVAAADSTSGRLEVAATRIAFRVDGGLGFMESDTLVGPLVLLNNQGWEIPPNTLLIPTSQVRSAWTHPPFGMVGGVLWHAGPVWMQYDAADLVQWDSVAFDINGQLLEGRLLSGWKIPAGLVTARLVRGKGERIHSGEFTQAATRVELLPTGGTSGSPDPSENFSWVDSIGQDLTSVRKMELREDLGPQPARCGALACGIRLQAPYDSMVAWLTLKGSHDTVFRKGRFNEWGDPVAAPGWAVQQFTSKQGWTGLAGPASYLRWESAGPAYLLAGQGLRWQWGKTVWRLAKNEGNGFVDPVVRPGIVPPQMGEKLLWTATPPLLGAKRAFRFPPLGNGVWTNRYRWADSVTLFAQARITPDKSRRQLLGSRPLDVEIQLAVVPGGTGTVAVADPPQFQFRVAGRGVLGGVTSNLGSVGVAVDSAGWRLRTGTNDDLDVPLNKLDSMPHTSVFFWTDGAGIQRLADSAFDPAKGLRFDTGTAEVLDRTAGITFAVSDVQPDTSPLPRLDRKTWLSRVAENGGWKDSTAVAGNPGTDRLIDLDGGHAFLDALVVAWNQHRPVRLAPDAVWMLLLEALVSRVEANPKACRDGLVRHAGVQKLKIDLSSELLANLDRDSSWNRIATDLLDSLARFSVRGRKAWEPQFTTTTPTRALATRMRVLQMHARYFDYRGMAACGIPRITLEGTPEDWQRLRDRVPELGQCGLEPWARRMTTVLDEFVRAARGQPSRSFWRSFVRYTPPSMDCGGVPSLDGWITSFFPVGYDGKPQTLLRSMELGSIPSDHGTFPFTADDEAGASRHFQLVSGFSGVGQAADGALFPELGWSAWEGDTRETE